MQNEKLTIALDCDDVLFDCNEEAVKMLNKAYGTHYSKTDIKTWGYTGSLLDERICFFEDPGFVSNQKLLPGAKEFVQQLLSMDGVKDIVLVTYHSVPVPDISPSSDYCRKSIPIMLSLHATSHVFRQTSCLTMVYIILIQLSI